MAHLNKEEVDSVFTIDDECVTLNSSADDLVVEPLPEEIEQAIHNQLPTVEEYKANISTSLRPTTTKTSRQRLLILGCSIALIFSVTLALVIPRSNGASDDETSLRTAEVEDFLFSNQISSLPDVKDPSTSQHKAAAFVADGDLLRLDFYDAESARRFAERYVLALLYYEFNGPEWFYKFDFLSAKDHCDWNAEMVTGAGKEIIQGVICNGDGFVEKIHLAWNNLQGNRGLPREIGYFRDLETLHMYYSDIKGLFPESFRGMPALKGIGLMNTGISGTIPQWIGEMTQLTTLALSDNELVGTLPDSMSSLTNLRILGLDGNNAAPDDVDVYRTFDGAYGIAGKIDPIKKLKNLEALYLENTAITGDLNNFDWPNLVELDVSDTYLDMSLPTGLLNHPKLRVLDINRNPFMDGAFPTDIFQNTALEYFSAHGCGLTGQLSDRIGFLLNLKHLDVSENALTGTIPDIVSQMTDLRYLSTSGNNFTQEVLVDLSRLTDLTELSMKGNNLIGRMPGWISSLTNLKLLDLDANGLLGSIPNDIGRLTDLRFLLLNRNGLTGTIPNSMKNIKNLDVFLIDSNNIRGDAQAICEQDDIDMKHFIADCYPGANGQRPEVSCRCCTQCCADGDMSCNDKSWTSNFDPVWEYGFLRPQYTFRLENAPATYSKRTNQDADDATLP